MGQVQMPGLNTQSIDSVSDGAQDKRVMRFCTFLLLFIVMLGLAMQRPAQALAAPMGAMGVQAMADRAVDVSTREARPGNSASMPDCMAAMQRDARHIPGKCGMAGCVLMAASGALMMLADGPLALPLVIVSERDERIGISSVLRGRSTAPEPEPPSALI